MISIANFTHANTHTPLQYTNSYNATQFVRENEELLERFEFQNATYNSSISPFDNFTEYAEIPYYIKATSVTFCIVIMCLGVIGNVLVPIVILKTKDMRNSTNIFLVNLSIADLLVLLVCTTTTLVEINSKPETWVLGKELCLAVPFVELTVAHASVLTILAISFERYYAICEPLRAGYVCTKTRATLICALAWFFAALFTSPVLAMVELHEVAGQNGTYSQCVTHAVTVWQNTFFIFVVTLLYILPLIILIVLYSLIAKNLISAASKVVLNKTVDPNNARARKQVTLMLGTVVLCFFLCLTPYRVLILWIIISPSESSDNITPEKWYTLLFFSKIMIYVNSAINPILYNLMSSKFRIGFCKVCICYKKSSERIQNRRAHGTVTNGSTRSSSLTRTTNSLKKLFTHRSSLDKSDTQSESKDVKDDGTLKTNRFFDRLFTNKRIVRQQSAPVCANPKTKVINRIKSEASILDTSNVRKSKESRGDATKYIGHSNINAKNRLDIELESNRTHGSLRRSILINSAKAKSLEVDPNKKFVCYQKIKVDCVVGYQKSKRIDDDFSESFV